MIMSDAEKEKNADLEGEMRHMRTHFGVWWGGKVGKMRCNLWR